MEQDSHLQPALDLLSDAVIVEWSRHEHIIMWSERIAAELGSPVSEVFELAALLAIRDAQMTGVPSPHIDESAMTEAETRAWQRDVLSTIAQVARSPELWDAWAMRDGEEITALLRRPAGISD